MYSESITKYTNPITASDTTHQYAAGFLDNFLPYVATKYDASSKLYQLQVNHGTKEASGCGTYNHPYVIATGTDIVNFCNYINSNAKGAKIRTVNYLRAMLESRYGIKTRVEDWTKSKGLGLVTNGIVTRFVELHWYDVRNVGFKFDMKEKIEEY